MPVAGLQAGFRGPGKVELVIDPGVRAAEIQNPEELVAVRVHGFDAELVADLADPDLRLAQGLLASASGRPLDRPNLQVGLVPGQRLDA